VITTHRATTKAYWESKKWHQQKPLLPPPKQLTREEEIQLKHIALAYCIQDQQG
jgi:hypothetical protein